jgi:large subunit ribosomal protein L9
MDIILLEKIRNLGNLGDQVAVKGGYARNFLIPSGKAVVANEANKAEFESRRAELEATQKDLQGKAESRRAQLENIKLEIKSRASEEGKLFGSVGINEIADAIKEKGVEVSRSEVQMPDGPMKELGEFKVLIVLHSEVSVTIEVNVIPE